MKTLIVEDAEEVIETMTLLLRIRWPDCRVLATHQGEAALRMLDTESPDLVILDLGLPDRYGLDVLREMREFSDTPIIAITANQGEVEKAGFHDPSEA